MIDIENCHELFKQSKTIDYERLMFVNECFHSILIRRTFEHMVPDHGVFFAALVDTNQDPTAKRWWVMATDIPVNYPSFDFSMQLCTDLELRQHIEQWANFDGTDDFDATDEIIKDRANLFPERRASSENS